MFGKSTIAAAAIGIGTIVGASGAAVVEGAVAWADPVPVDAQPLAGRDMKQVLTDYRAHAGEQFEVHGLVYSDVAVWTLVFVTDGPAEFYTVDGARAEIIGPDAGGVRQGDIFTGTITVTGQNGVNDPVVHLENVRVVGHQE